MSKHTAEPWELLEAEDDKNYLRIRGTVWGGRYKIANVVWPRHSTSAQKLEEKETLANATRIVECVNACVGMAYPSEDIATLKALSVKNILLDVTPGDGSGLEIYATCISDVSETLSKMDEEIAELKRQRDELLEFVRSCAQYQGDGTACHSTYQVIVAEMGERARYILERT